MKLMLMDQTSDRNCPGPSLGSVCPTSIVVVGRELEALHARKKQGGSYLLFCLKFKHNINDIPSISLWPEGLEPFIIKVRLTQ